MDFNQYQKELNLKWRELEKKLSEDEDFKSAGKGKIRVSEEFFFTQDATGHPGLLIITNNEKIKNNNKIPICKGWKIDILENKIIMSLKNKEYNDFFRDIVNLILTKVYLSNYQKEERVNFFFKDLISAKSFFDSEAIPSKLSSESETGLFGEISLLSEFVSRKYSNKESLSFWTGPTKKHDFTTSNIILETKTTKSDNKKNINTSSNYQLSPVFEKELYLSFIQIQKNLSGRNLNMLINEYSSKLKNESELLLNDFYIKLRQSGYYGAHKEHYKDKYYINKMTFYHISKSFPYIKINEIKTHEAISGLSVTYKIDLEQCESFRINEEKVMEKL